MTTSPIYTTPLGSAFQGDALDLLNELDDESVNLVFTSPPFALQRQKEYGNRNESEYVDWLIEFAAIVKKKLRGDGSFVLDLGGAYQSKRPVRSLYNYHILIRLCEELDFRLAEEFFWFNPAKLPSPIEWVNKKKIRTKDSVNTVWWLSKSDYPKADIRRVLVPYSDRMKKLHRNPEKYYSPKVRPSGHNIGTDFATDNGGAIPSNLLQIPNTESVSQYLRLCSALEIEAHPARFPVNLPKFFIKFLTEPGDLVLDIFAGSNTTGLAAETTQRRWLAFEKEQQYLAASVLRFLDKDVSEEQARVLYMRLLDFQESIHIKQAIITAEELSEELSEEIIDTQLSLFEV